MSQPYRPSSSHSHPLPIRPAGPPGQHPGIPSPPQTGYGYGRPPSHGGPPSQRGPQGTVLPGIDELIRGMPRDQVPPGPSVAQGHPHHGQQHQQEPDYSRIPGPPSPPWPNPPRRNDSPQYAYSQGGAPPRGAPQSAQGGMYTPPSSGGSRPPTGQHPQGMQPGMPHMVPHGGQIPAGTSPLPFPSVTYATPLPASPNGSPGGAPPPHVQVLPNGIPLDGPYYLTSHPYTTIYFAPPNQFGPARNARACKKCRQRKVRCSAAGGLGFAPGEPGMKCERCERAGEECVFEERQVSRRRTQGSTGSGGSGRASGSSGRSVTAEDDDYDDDEESISTPTATTSTLRTPASSVASPAPRGSTKAQGPPPAPSSGAAGRGQAPMTAQQQAYYRTQSMPPK
ncbi:hypothetical protein CALCODRAFT_481651 [Calocera cornea HHB12733]|uniref:Zn(2)-C6 fungal-type domain-containing protein n=1 Tax=Calocera cornea HHB12733 TaxID=1353952 RepID=A0A165HFL8_9BASI|nr:hypothetical protein CALCODRAFT_481651 [Calocera cornea HHB12733]